MADKLIWVKSGKNDGRVALWEAHETHLGGEAFVPGDGRTVQVWPTANVQQKLASGQLAMADAPKASEPEEEEESPRMTAAEARAAKRAAQADS